MDEENGLTAIDVSNEMNKYMFDDADGAISNHGSRKRDFRMAMDESGYSWVISRRCIYYGYIQAFTSDIGDPDNRNIAYFQYAFHDERLGRGVLDMAKITADADVLNYLITLPKGIEIIIHGEIISNGVFRCRSLSECDNSSNAEILKRLDPLQAEGIPLVIPTHVPFAQKREPIADKVLRQMPW